MRGRSKLLLIREDKDISAHGIRGEILYKSEKNVKAAINLKFLENHLNSLSLPPNGQLLMSYKNSLTSNLCVNTLREMTKKTMISFSNTSKTPKNSNQWLFSTPKKWLIPIIISDTAESLLKVHHCKSYRVERAKPPAVMLVLKLTYRMHIRCYCWIY